MENKKSEMSVEYNMDEMKKSLKNLKETECYDVEKYTYSLLHQTRQLEYFYCNLVHDGNVKDTVTLNGTDDTAGGNIPGEFYGGDDRCLLIVFSKYDIKGLELSEEKTPFLILSFKVFISIIVPFILHYCKY